MAKSTFNAQFVRALHIRRLLRDPGNRCTARTLASALRISRKSVRGAIDCLREICGVSIVYDPQAHRFVAPPQEYWRERFFLDCEDRLCQPQKR